MPKRVPDGQRDGASRSDRCGLFEPPPLGPNRGRLITFEGGEGAGKSTQIRLLSQYLETMGIAHITTREPGGTPQAEALRALLVNGCTDTWDGLSEALLMTAARRDHVRRLIWPHLAQGQWVLCDRFADSSRVYQGYAREVGEEVLAALTHMIMGDFVPDLTFVLMLTPEKGLERKMATPEDRFERLGPFFHQRIQEGFEQLLADNPDRCVRLEGHLPPDLLSRNVQSILKTRGLLPTL